MVEQSEETKQVTQALNDLIDAIEAQLEANKAKLDKQIGPFEIMDFASKVPAGEIKPEQYHTVFDQVDLGVKLRLATTLVHDRLEWCRKEAASFRPLGVEHLRKIAQDTGFAVPPAPVQAVAKEAPQPSVDQFARENIQREQAKIKMEAEAKRQAEEKRLDEERAKKAAQTKAEAEKKLKAEAEAEAKRVAEEKRLAEEKAKQEAQSKAQAEQARLEQEARRQQETARLAQELRAQEEKARQQAASDPLVQWLEAEAKKMIRERQQAAIVKPLEVKPAQPAAELKGAGLLVKFGRDQANKKVFERAKASGNEVTIDSLGRAREVYDIHYPSVPKSPKPVRSVKGQ